MKYTKKMQESSMRVTNVSLAIWTAINDVIKSDDNLTDPEIMAALHDAQNTFVQHQLKMQNQDEQQPDD